MSKVGTRIRIESDNAPKASSPEDGAPDADIVAEQFTREFTAVLQHTREKQSKELTSESFGGSPEDVVNARQEVAFFGDVAQKLTPLVDRLMRATPEQINTAKKTELLLVFGDKFYHAQEFRAASMFFYEKVLVLDEMKDKTPEESGDTVTMEQQHSGQFSWLTLNGSVLIYSITKPLQALGFSKEVVAYLKWSLLAMGSAVALSTTKYIMWRLQLGSAICDCYEDLALKETTKADQHLKSAVACAAYLQQVVQRLRKEEELDVPLPVEVQRILTQAETTSAMLAARVKAAAGHQPFTRSTIEAAFPAVRDQMRAAIDAMESLARETKQKQGGQGTFVLIPSTPHPPTNETQSELLAFVMEITTPMLKPLVEGEELLSQSTLDKTVFPISFHLAAIRHCFQLGQPDDQMILLIQSANARLKSTSDSLLERDAAIISCLLELFEALHEIQQSWLSWESLSEDERLESSTNPRQQLPVSGGAIPATKVLVRLSKAMQDCAFHGDGTISRTNQELMTSVALQMWREFAIPMLKDSRPDQESEIPETERTAPDALTGTDDEYLYRWCGELFFIQSMLLYRKIAKLCATIEEVDTANGPNTEDCTYDLLHADNNDEDAASDAAKPSNIFEASTPQENKPTEDQETLTAQADPSDASEVSEVDRLFGELLEKTAGCCKLFRLASCWQGLQAVSQQLWNAIWLAWVAPSRIGTSSMRLEQLSTCIDALLDMMDTVMNGSQDQKAASTTVVPLTTSNSPAPASTEQSMALSTVVYAATSALNVDQTWFTQLMAYCLRVFCSFQDWKSIVQKGSRYHSLCGSSAEGSRFSEQNFPILIYAQQQIVNHKEVLLTTAQEELNAYITAFQEQEAKKKKKKSRLVVEEVLSPEEITFRANKQVMEQHIQELTADRDLEREKLADLSDIYDELSNAINKSHQALNTCHELVEKYRCLDKRTADVVNAHRHQDKLLALRRQIVASYNRCVILSRQKRQKRIVCQALQEAGDFHLACGDVKSAIKSWLESLDNAFSTLNVGASWRDVLTPSADQFLESANKDNIAGDELWVGMQCCCVLSKLVMLSSGDKLHKAIDYALMAAAIFTQFYGCSLPHPTKCFLFGSYRMLGQFWPGRKLLTDPDRVSPFMLGIMLVLVPEVLLLYGQQYAATAMPIITGYEYVAEYCLEDANHVANARRFRVEALVQCGRFQEAFQVVMKLMRGGATPRSNSGVPELDTLIFHDSKPILDESNRAALNWLISLNAEQALSDLKRYYHEALVGHILVVILHLAVGLARHESRYDRDTAITRSAAKKLAQSMLLLIKPSETSIPPAQTPRNNGTDPTDGDTDTEHPAQRFSWEQLQLHRIRADIHLQLSYLAFYEGEWGASRSSTMDAISEYNAIPSDPEHQLHLELDQKLKFSLVLARGTFVAKCRAQTVACSLAQTNHRAAFEAAEVAIEEAKTTGEEHLRQHLESLRLQTEVFLGEREKTESKLFVLRQEALAYHTSASLTYVHTLQALSSLLRSKALLSSQPVALHAVNERLSEAEHVLDALLEHDGWIGVSSDHPQSLERLNLYRPGIPDFVQVHADLAQVLLESPLNCDSESVQARQERALRSVENGIRALDHTTQRMSIVKARLLLLKGVLLSKKLYGTVTKIDSSASVSPVHGEKNLEQRFEECVEAFTGSIKSSIEEVYDRQLVRLALIELVDLFGLKLVPGNEDTHVQAAFHYLNLALEVQKHEAVLFDTLELQNGTITSVEKLPASVSASINAQTDAKVDASAPPLTNSKAPDVAAIVNYFVRLLRMQHILPVSTTALQDTCVLLHSFLVQHHSTYSRIACLMDLPAVPSSDPEIRAGMVCALWGQDLAPVLSSRVGDTARNDKLTFYFTLGTTKASIAEDSPAAGNADAIARMEKFAASPLLSKRGNVDRQAVQHLKTALSKLRTQMEDEDSLLIDRNAFPTILRSLLCQIQQLFRGVEPSSGDGSQDNVNDTLGAVDFSNQSVQDTFRNSISVSCTLDMVRRLEDLFSINKGVNVADNELCYFLRDLLD
ncbi:uncharacterized protein IUM83_05441 [Phytophthora cinnamomi]|uniref:uncharacterized protein n=1 Tax=Phytophthora cinnamomi TaxID=4785 RepID=UPI00355A5B72|nr:hypothetical protein IUM83_05441 [Phytophthora cinnamomi]